MGNFEDSQGERDCFVQRVKWLDTELGEVLLVAVARRDRAETRVIMANMETGKVTMDDWSPSGGEE